MNKKEKIAYKKVIGECNCKYKKGFNILIEYFDSIAEEEKPKVNKQLKRLGL